MIPPINTDDTSRWRALLRNALMVLIAVAVLVHVAVQVPIPPLIVFVVLFGVVLYLLGREGRARKVGVVLGGVGALLFLVGNFPFVLADLSHPDSLLGFIASGSGIVGAVVGFVAMLGVLLRWGSAPVRPLLAAGAAAILAVIGVGIVATLGVDEDERQEGDVVLVAEDADYVLEAEDPEREDQAELTVEQGGAVFIDNKDLYRHTFVIEVLGVDEEVQAGIGRRVVIDAAPGEYEFHCDVEGHEDDMKGRLTVR